MSADYVGAPDPAGEFDAVLARVAASPTTR